MSKLAIISGGGDLPLIVGKNLINKKYDILFLGIKDFVQNKLYRNYNYKEITLTSLKKIVDCLLENRIDQIIMLGNINRPSAKDIQFDLDTLKFIGKYLLESKGDNKLLSAISDFFLKKGFPLFDWRLNCPELFVNENHITIFKPSKNALKNKDKGLKIFKIIGKADLSQTVILQNQMILGIEAAEGTDELISRCYKYKKNGDKGIVLKLSKYNQNNLLDIPTIGMQTLINIKKYNYEGIFLEKNKCLLIDKEKVINYCNNNKLFISTVLKN